MAINRQTDLAAWIEFSRTAAAHELVRWARSLWRPDESDLPDRDVEDED